MLSFLGIAAASAITVVALAGLGVLGSETAGGDTGVGSGVVPVGPVAGSPVVHPSWSRELGSSALLVSPADVGGE